MKIREIFCKSAIGKCGFPGGGLAINPYVGCGHGCVYCYARFIKRFTGHKEKWGQFVDARVNIAEILGKQLKLGKYTDKRIYIGTVTDPYQPIEKKYKLTRQILASFARPGLAKLNPVSILTKSDLVLRDLDLLKQLKDIDVNFTITTLDEKWKNLTEPFSPSIKQRLKAVEQLNDEAIPVFALMGPYWPFFTDPEKLFAKFAKLGVSHVFTESFNTTGGNWTGVEEVLKKHYPRLLPLIREIFFNKNKFYEFYTQAKKKIDLLSTKYPARKATLSVAGGHLPTTVYFGLGHTAKFKD